MALALVCYLAILLLLLITFLKFSRCSQYIAFCMLKYDLIKLNAYSLTSQCFSLSNETLRLIESNALAKAKNMPHTTELFRSRSLITTVSFRHSLYITSPEG